MCGETQFLFVSSAPCGNGRLIKTENPPIGVKIIAILGGDFSFSKLAQFAVGVPTKSGEVLMGINAELPCNLAYLIDDTAKCFAHFILLWQIFSVRPGRG